MSRVAFGPVDGKDPDSIEQRLKEHEVAINRVEFGNPADPDLSSTLQAGLATSSVPGHPGSLENLHGAWCEQTVGSSDLNTARTFTHNLGLGAAINSEPNCRWILMGFSHTGTGAGVTSTVSVGYDANDSAGIGTDSIQLRVYADDRTVDDTDKLTVSLFIIPAIRFFSGTPV